MSDAPELLPCPFCGGVGIHLESLRGYKIECENRNSNRCPMNMRTNYRASESCAASQWNTRAPDAQIMAHPKVKELIDALGIALVAGAEVTDDMADRVDAALAAIKAEGGDQS